MLSDKNQNQPKTGAIANLMASVSVQRAGIERTSALISAGLKHAVFTEWLLLIRGSFVQMTIQPAHIIFDSHDLGKWLSNQAMQQGYATRLRNKVTQPLPEADQCPAHSQGPDVTLSGDRLSESG